MRFSMFAASVHGKKYREHGLPCQDSCAVLEFEGVQAIAVADGHGGKDYFRSDIGSRLAVETAMNQIKIFCSELTDEQRFSVSGIQNFNFKLCEQWQESVKEHWHQNPVSSEEFRWQTVSDKYKARYQSDEQYITAAYGTTLICAVSIGSQILITQIGDGSCVVLQRDGEFKMPVPPDSENFANLVTSLCDADAYNKFRYAVLDCDENSMLAPVAIFLSTDGLDDCYPIFENERHLYKLYADSIIDSMIKNGFAATDEALRCELLPFMTEHGSNDDISLAYLAVDDLNLLKRTLGKYFLLTKTEMAEENQLLVMELQAEVAEQAARIKEKFSPRLQAERRHEQ